MFTLTQLEDVFRQAMAVPTINGFYLRGRNLYLPSCFGLSGLASHDLGFSTGIVTNGYWATSLEDALAWLRPLHDAGLDRIEISYDSLHGDSNLIPERHPGLLAARQLGLSANLITLEPPQTSRDPWLLKQVSHYLVGM